MVSRLISAWHARQTLRDISLLLGEQNLTLVDVGSAGGVEPRWKKIASKLNYIGFEPDARSYEGSGTTDRRFATYTMFPSAVWNHDGPLSIYLCRKPEVSSRFLPDSNFISRFPKAGRFDVVGQVEVSAYRLDSLPVSHCDFIKLDIQGGELAALQGAENLLFTALGLEVEVEFSQVYEGQPLFGDVCEYLRRQGFEFIDFTNLSRWSRNDRKGVGQCIFGDALFLRVPEWLQQQKEHVDLGVIARYMAILALYRRPDLMAACQCMFTDILSGDIILNQNIGVTIRRLNNQMEFIRKISKASSFVLKLGGAQSRCYITY